MVQITMHTNQELCDALAEQRRSLCAETDKALVDLASVREVAKTEIERLRSALEEIANGHIGDQPAEMNVSDEEWARRCHMRLRRIAIDALKV